MTNFVKSNFEYSGGYLHYNTADGERKFVARFKRGPITKAKFQAALIKYYDVDGDGNVGYEEFLSGLRDSLNPRK